MKRSLPVLFLTTLGVAFGVGQTPPQKPNTTPIPATPPLELPGPPGGTSPDVAKPITADEAAAIALRLQPSVSVALAQEYIARGQVQQALAGLLPTLTSSASYTYATRLGSLGVPNSSGGVVFNQSFLTGFSNAITLRELLFDFNRTRDIVEEAKATAKAATFGLTASQADLVFQVKSQYYIVAQDLQLIAVQEASQKSDQDQLDLSLAQLNSGLGAPADVVTATANLAAATSQLVLARQNYLVARVGLAALMGLDPRTPIDVSNLAEPALPTPDLNLLVDDGLRNRPEILQLQQTLRAAGISVSVARKSILPTVSATASVGDRGPENPFATDTASLGIALNWAIYDGGLAAGLIESAKANVLLAQSNLAGVSQTVVSDVSNAFVGLQAAKERVAVADSGVLNAQEGLRLAQGRYRAGVTTFIEVTQAQATLVAAESEQASAQASLQTARAQMARAVGARVKFPAPAQPLLILPSTAAQPRPAGKAMR